MSTSPLDALPLPLARRLDKLCDRFDAAWRAAADTGEPPRLEDYLDATPEPERTAAVRELLAIEVEYRRQAGESPHPREYLERFPTLDRAWLAGCCGASSTPTTNGVAAPALAAQQRVGKFQLLERVGAGAHGAVWRARDTELNRDVALKVPHPGLLEAPEYRERFQREARAAAQLRHPGIVTVFEVATLGGQPVLVSDFVAGRPLRDLIREHRWPFREAAALVAKVAEALDYAHGMGVVHRDVKPANILLQSGTADARRWTQIENQAEDSSSLICVDLRASAVPLMIPKIADFGLALREEDATLTQEGQLIGTPAYMSPEQAAGRGHAVDRRSDVYSLGVVFYELLTGRLPFDGPKESILPKLLHEEPKRPRQVDGRIPRDLETVCLKALTKEPAQRYATAREMADDLQRWLNGEPIRARPVSAWERAWRRARCRPAAAALILVSAVAVLALGGMITGSFFYARLQTEVERAEMYRYFHHIAAAHAAWRDSEVGRVGPLLEACPADRRSWEWHYLKRLCHGDLFTLHGHTNVVRCVAFSPDGQRLASASYDGTVRVWDVAARRVLVTFTGHTDQIWSLAFSPDGKRLASGSWDRSIKVWDPETGAELVGWKDPDGKVFAVAFSRDGKWLASGGDGTTVKVWDVETAKELLALRGHTRLVMSVAFNGDKTQLASVGTDHTVRIWYLGTGREPLRIEGREGSSASLAYSPDARQLAVGCWDGTVNVLDAATGQRAYDCKGHNGPVMGIGFSPDGTRLASAGGDGVVKVWEAGTGQEVLTLKGHTKGVMSVAFSPDGAWLASGSQDETVKVWETSAGQVSREARTFQGHAEGVRAVAISRDGEWLASGSVDGRVTVLQAASLHVAFALQAHDGSVRSVAFSPDGKRIASSSLDRTVSVRDARTGKEAFALARHPDEVHGVTFSPDGQLLATACDDGQVRIWDATTGELIRPLVGHANWVRGVAFSPDGKRLASASFDKTVRVWDPATGRELLHLAGHTNPVWSVAFSTDGQRLASASRDTTVKIWNAATGQVMHTLEGHNVQVWGVAFSPDGKRLASVSQDHTVRLWDTSTGQLALTLKGHTSMVGGVAFSPDGHRLISASYDRTLKIWDATPLAP